MSESVDSGKAESFDENGTPMERVERAGAKGWRWPDGTILWDTGEKEVPTSGLSDEQKRAQAYADAVGGAPALKEGAAFEDIAFVKRQIAEAIDTGARNEERKAYAKRIAAQKPAKTSAEADALAAQAPKSQPTLAADARLAARRLLDREIDRCEELKSLAISGNLALMYDGRPVPHRNPPMVLHDIVLAALKTAEIGSAADMMHWLEQLLLWQAAASASERSPTAGGANIAVTPTDTPDPPGPSSRPGAGTGAMWQDGVKGGQVPDPTPPIAAPVTRGSSGGNP